MLLLYVITMGHTTLGGTLLDEGSTVAETSIWQNTTLKRVRHPRDRRDSNPQSQQSRGRRPTP